MPNNNIVEELEPIFKPRSIAFIGASNRPWKWGHWMVERPLRTGFRGGLYPVNLRDKEIAGLPAYRSILDIPDEVDLAVITVPARTVTEVMEQCVKKGVKGAILISAGFAELGEEGRALQAKVIEICRSGGIRFLGPNCMGLWSAAGRLNLCFDRRPREGSISFVSQSGTFGMFLAQMASAKGYGLAKVVSIGNQADLTMADYIEYLAQDPDTKVIVLYIEGVVQGRRLFEVCREVVPQKPIIVYKAGRTAVGARATMSHTASLAGEDAIFEALCRQVGLLRGYEAMHPFDMAEALASQPLPKGKRVAIISGGGGHCVATADFCAQLGLEVPEFDRQTQLRLKDELAPHAPIPKNPIDLAGGIRSPLAISNLAEKVARLDYIDAIITTPPMGGGGQMPRRGGGFGALSSRDPADSPFPDLGPLTPTSLAKIFLDAAEAIATIPQRYNKPVIISQVRAVPGGAALDIISAAGIPTYESPEESARAMYALCRYAEFRRELGAL